MIGDRGSRRLASLLDPDYCVQTLDLCDNQIHANGCMHLGAHLAENMTCETMNLRLNRCEDNGVAHLFQDLCVNKYLKTLNVSCNDLTVRCVPYMNSMISDNSTLSELDLSANPLYTEADSDDTRLMISGGPSAGPGGGTTAIDVTLQAGGLLPEANVDGDGGDSAPVEELIVGMSVNSPFGVFARCVMKSTALLKVDVRQCGLPPELAERIVTAVKHRELRARGIPVEAYERSKQLQQEELEEGPFAETDEMVDGEGEGQPGEAPEGAEGGAAEGNGDAEDVKEGNGDGDAGGENEAG